VVPDHGPIFVHRHANGRREEVILDWGYNAWGDKYPPYDLDDVIPTASARNSGFPSSRQA
jgi:agmatine deiminase